VTEPLALSGRTEPPMVNGELVFEAPWQARAFGMARALCEQGLYTWDEFRAALIAAIARWESLHEEQDNYNYYDCFVEALETVLVTGGTLEVQMLAEQCAALRARPHGHDHQHNV